MNKNKKPSIAHYWTSRYLFALTIGIFFIGIIMALWIKYTTLDYRLSFAKFIAEDAVSRITSNFTGDFFIEDEFVTETENRNFDSTQLDPHTYLVNRSGNVIGSNVTRDEKLFTYINPSILVTDKEYLIIQHASTNEDYYLISRDITLNNQVIGWVLVLDTKEHFTQVDNQYYQLIIALLVVGLIGWLAIYMLSRKFAKPLVELTKAAKEIEEGNYHIELKAKANEQELYELIHSFKQMSSRLEKLEQTRNELLAGVTHELKTPITSVSGLLQAIDQKMVTKEEEAEFIQLSIKETTKLKKMVDDLLEFNSYVSNTLPLSNEIYSVDELISSMVHDWKQMKDNDQVEVELQLEDTYSLVEVDYIRFNQIIVNLLNNAMQAMEERKKIIIKTYERDQQVYIEVIDSGKGIPEEEQAFIFERFYRGENKKYGTRGLGLGLSLSKMLALAMQGDLILKNSSSQGTTFLITLPIFQEE